MAATFTFPAELGDGFFDGSGIAIVASAVTSGSCGKYLTWTFDGTDTLTISGTGEMANWKNSSEVPWKSYSDSIKSVVIENGVTYIGNHAFESHRHLESVAISDSVTSIGDNAFCSCMNLTSITIPDSVKFIGDSVFFNCTSLESIFLPNTLDFFGFDLFDTTTRIKYTVDNKSVTITSVTLGSGQTSVTIPDKIGGKPVTVVYIQDGTTVLASATQIKYSVNGDKVTITGATLGSGQTSVTIPDTIDGKSVTSIGDSAFERCTSLTSITIPNSVNSIGSYAFDNCTSLKSITIPSSVNSIGSGAFEYCASLESITIPDSVTSIERAAFYNCSSLESITIPDGVTSIGEYAFKGCSSLASITIPGSVTSIGESAFKDCSNLESIYLPASASVGTDAIPASASQIKYTVDNESVTITGVTLGSGQTSVTIPETIDGKTVTSIGNKAFYYCTILKSITIPDGVTSIGNEAFYYCPSLASITIPNGVTSIGNKAFYNCQSLKSITIPDSVTSIGGGAFSHCIGLTSITIPDSVTSIESSAFFNCTSLKSISVDGNNPNYCSVEGVLFNKNKTTLLTYPIGKGSSYVIPSGVTSIGDYAFRECESLTSITIPGGVTSIGKQAFFSCKRLTSITIPGSVTSIREQAFYNCSSLESIFLPESLSEIAEKAIPKPATQIKYTVDTYGNVTITSVTLGRGKTSVTIPDTIDGKTVTVVYIQDGATGIDVPASAAQIKYTVDDSNNVTITSVTLGSGQTSVTIPDTIDGKAVTVVFTKDGTNISAPSSATQIKYTVSGDNVTVTGVTLGGGQSSFTIPSTIDGKTVTAVCIKDGATGIDVPASATQIRYTVDNENVTIKGATLGEGVTSVTIPDTIDGKTVTSIGIIAFKRCSSLASITIPNGVTSIGDSAFGYCTSLTSITIPDSVNSIGNNAFRSCENLTSITIPDSVTSIGEYAFYYCTSLKSITIPGSVNSIGNNAFKSCSSLTSIFLPERLTSIGTDAIPTSAAQIKYTVDNENVTITSVTLGSGQTSVTIPETIGGKAVTVVFTKDGTNISAPSSATQIKYTVSGDNVTVTGVTLGSGQTSLTIPDTIGGKPVTVVYIRDGATGIDVPASATQIKYTVDDSNNVTITGSTPGEGVTSVTIPDTIDGKTVTSIGDSAFYYCESLESITIPNGVTSIGDNAFYYCSSLTSITIPDSVTSIGEYAFYSCTSLTSITIPDSVTSIGNFAFFNCISLTSITIPDSVTSIERGAFNSCSSLESITIPDGVTSIGEYAFYCCSSLTSITIPGSVTSIGENAFKGCSNLESIFIPDSVVSIGTDAILASAAQVKYTVDTDGNVTITSVTLGSGQTSVTIPDTIGGNKVISVAKDYQQYVGVHTHVGGTATCTSKAVCELCGKKYGETGAHSLTKHDAVPATCTTDGNIDYYECNLCDKLFTDESGTTETTPEAVTIPAAGHSFGEKWESNTEGHYHVCTVCGEQSASEAHTKDNGTVTKEATPTENGTITYKCTVCGANMGDETITAKISSFDVTSSGVVVKYTVTGSTEVKSQTLKFSEVTEEMVELMKSKDIQLVIDFVNYSTTGSDTIILTSAQIKAIEYVLEHDFRIAS